MDEVTLGELARRMDALHADVRAMRSAMVEQEDVRTLASGWEKALTAHETLANARMERVEGRVGALEASQTWVVRSIVAVILVAVISAFIVDPFRN